METRVEKRLRRRREAISGRFGEALKRKNWNQVEFEKIADIRCTGRATNGGNLVKAETKIYYIVS